jgi:hypothetical protein
MEIPDNVPCSLFPGQVYYSTCEDISAIIFIRKKDKK